MSEPYSNESETKRVLEECLQHKENESETSLFALLAAQPENRRKELEGLLAGDAFLEGEAEEQLAKGEGPLKRELVLGDYRLIQELGRGGMGVVWEAEQISLKRRVALKFLRGNATLSSCSTVRLDREARAGAALSHPAIVQVFGHEQSDGFEYIVQELIPGGLTLVGIIDKLKKRSVFQPRHYRDVAGFFREIALALHHSHESGVIHRDIKPANILISPVGRPKVSDFGLAKIRDSLHSSGNNLLGTPRYMSPEQVGDRRAGIDGRTDVFSLGATLYEVLAFRPAFEGDTPEQTIQKIKLDDPPDPRRAHSRVPRDLAVICLKALEKNRRFRYQTMLEFAEDLDRFLNNEPIHARPAGTLYRMAKWAKRRPAVALLMLGLPTMVALGTWSVLSWGDVQAQSRAERMEAAEGYTERGFFFLGEARWPDALSMLNEAMSLHPNSEAAIGKLQALLRSNGLGAAETYLRSLESQSGLTASYPALKRAGLQILHERGRAEQEEALLNEPRTAEEWFLEGECWLVRAIGPTRDKPRRANAQDRQAIRKAQEAFLRAMMLSKSPRALYFYKCASTMNDSPESLLLLDLIVEMIDSQWPDSVLAACYIGTAYYGAGHYEEAAASFEQAVQRNPQFAPAHYNLSVTLQRLDRLAEAREAAAEAIRLDSDNMPAYLSLGIALQGLGMQEDAVDAFEKAAELDPDSALAHYNLGIGLQEQGKPVESARALRRAIELDPDYAAAIGSLAGTLIALGQFRNAADTAHRALELDSEIASAHTAIGYVLMHKGEWKAASDAYKEAIRINPNEASSYINLGIVLKRLEKYEEARDALTRATEIEPQHVSAHLNLALLLEDLRDFEGAKASYRAVLRIDEEHPKALCGLGSLLYFEEQYEEALTLLRNGHKFGSALPGWKYPSEQWVRECESALEFEQGLRSILERPDSVNDWKKALKWARLAWRRGHAAEEVDRLWDRALRLADEQGEELNRDCYIWNGATPREINKDAWSLVDPDREIRKTDVALGLTLAEANSNRVPSNPMFLDTLAWALLANSRCQEALAKSREALERATDKEAYQRYLDRMEFEVAKKMRAELSGAGGD